MTTKFDDAKLNEIVGRVLGDIGGAVSIPLVLIGDALGLYPQSVEAGRIMDGRRAGSWGRAGG